MTMKILNSAIHICVVRVKAKILLKLKKSINKTVDLSGKTGDKEGLTSG